MENNQNIADTPKYKGVRKRKWGKWVSEIRLPNSRDRIWLGSYDSPEKAARAFDAAQFCLRGPNANFNFPHNPPHIPGGRSMSPDEIRAAAARYANVSAGEDVHVEESASSVSDCGTTSSTVQIECGGGTVGLESSFYEQLSLCSNGFESGNYMSDFGLFPDFGDFNSTNYFSHEMDNNNNNAHTDNINFDYYDNNNNNSEDHYDSSIYQDSYLWSF